MDGLGSARRVRVLLCCNTTIVAIARPKRDRRDGKLNLSERDFMRRPDLS